ncbi:MAG: putative disulfide isomerase [Phenylobacterium sp.]|jgi:protein-disulfide isomerase|nr:putative disulfide isomerase [Phenylobacterium sp.]MDB5434580.1 putative disulfide isomerase [Phenylobacterium sp.]MDB5461888.1 putative disulfide isomerase [Phenylobacterium sp.]MDB5954242.1 putative disulfide isomerase [Ramlibacter sp.]
MLRMKVALLVALMVFGAAACSPKTGGAAGALPDDMDLGNPQAKVTVVEYASVGCPVCAKWQREVYPAFKAKYIDTGKIHYVFREMLVGQGPELAVAASGFLLARCAGKDKYFAVNDAIFKNQEQAFQAPRETLVDIAKSVGMTEDSFNKCINDETALKALNDRVERHNRVDHVNSTPTFVINGKSMEPGYHTLDEIDAAIKAAGG